MRSLSLVFLGLAIIFIAFGCSDDKDSKSLPVVAAMEVDHISKSSATVLAQIISTGGSSVMSYGVCLDVNPSPDIDNLYVEGSGKSPDGIFSVEITSLKSGTEYFVRAFAINEVGIAYSDDVSFITDKSPTSKILIKDVTDVSYTSARVISAVKVNEGFDLEEYGIVWDFNTTPDMESNKVEGEEIDQDGSFIVDLSDLESGKTYYVRVYAIIDAEVIYGEEYSFNTLETEVAKIGQSEIIEVAANSIKIRALIEDDMGTSVISRGVCWNTTGMPEIDDSFVEDEDGGIGEFVTTVSGLNSSTTYYFRAFAINSTGVSYGEEMVVETDAAELARVFAGGIESQTGITANYLGRVPNDGGSPVTSRGVSWSKEPNPTIEYNHIIEGEGTGTYRTRIEWLEPNTKYYVRGFAINGEGIAYGPEITFTTNKANVTYTLHRSANPTADELDAYERITVAMDEALYYYNKYTAFEKHLNVYYNPDVPTADGNFNGTIRFGNKNTMQKVTAMHEIAHTVGVGTTNHWRSNLIVGGVYQGANATSMLRYLTGNATARLNGDAAHFWPYGLNFYHEYSSEQDLINHCKIVYSMTLDGLGNW
ncbi:hypothetical protein [Natronoflexus pectinivorans]|uniref:Fibronectin type-III domain-containing protein n=1 Tax=Natronoflexus pectinivorans TaxID=682526 RepID=A0A4R2GLP5_9BACT|nr:hypothetical protein [Natronoflexus pectinivorans]TCO09863.1 hypothetical protein EV194_102292 [Natronoflexus pectinivorans]